MVPKSLDNGLIDSHYPIYGSCFYIPSLEDCAGDYGCNHSLGRYGVISAGGLFRAASKTPKSLAPHSMYSQGKGVKRQSIGIIRIVPRGFA